MPAFESEARGPILATVSLDLGIVRVTVSDGGRTTALVRPRDRSDPCDVATAGLARAGFSAGELVVSAPRTDGLPGDGAVLVDLELPSGSRLHGEALAADFHGTGRLGECLVSTGCGHIRLGRTGPVHLSSALGNVSVEHVAGDAEVDAYCGDVHIERIDGTAVLTRSTGDTRIGRVTGDISARTDSGDLRIDLADAAVEARAVRGGIRIGESARGPLDLETASGVIDVGLPGGIAAGLDLDSRVGTVYGSLDFFDIATDEYPATGTDVMDLQVYARTVIGDIVVRRVEPSAGEGPR